VKRRFIAGIAATATAVLGLSGAGFTGTALAGGWGDDGGSKINNCINIGIPILSGNAILGSANNANAVCANG